MSELLKSRHAFGSEANIDSALDQGLIDAYDILFLKEGKIGWIDAEGQKVILEDKTGVVSVDVLPEVGNLETVYICQSKFYFWNGEEFIAPIDEIGVSAEEVDAKIGTAVLNAMDKANAYTDGKMGIAEKIKVEAAISEHMVKKYEITSTPDGTLVNYGEKEIRVMCPIGTEWVKQDVGETGNANMYYMGFKAYAPEGAVSFKEGDHGVIIDKMFTFDDEFAGTDEFGRNYSICWLALASYDESDDTWTYFGANSTTSKYIGWDYVVEWYNADNVLIASDGIRINLSNEGCHSSAEPYYVNSAVDTANAYTDEQIANAVGIIEF